jgi:large subunit ribosomal protein L9
LFGSVTSHNIADVLNAEGMEVDHKNVLLDEPIKELGVFVVPVRLDRGVETRLKVWVVKE